MDHWIAAAHELHRQIDREFQANGLTIAFPQRDVHLNATGPFEVRMEESRPASPRSGSRHEGDSATAAKPAAGGTATETQTSEHLDGDGQRGG